MKQISRRFTPSTVYFLISFAGIISFFVFAFFRGAMAFDWLAMENNPNCQFIDYYMHIGFVADRVNLYKRATGAAGCFPPLAYCMYLFLYRLTYRVDSVPFLWIEAKNMDYSQIVFLYYSIVVVLLLLLAIWNTGENKPQKTALLLLSLLFSTVFFEGGIERGNSAILVLGLLLLALNLKDCKSSAMKESALLLIAICAAFKIYPAVFGLLYLKERRFKEAARLTVYGIILFVLPFYAFGGLEGFSLWLSNIRSTMKTMDFGRIQFIKGAVLMVSKHAFGKEMYGLASISPYLFFVVMIFLAGISDCKYRSVFFLCCVMSFFPANAYRYSLCYLSIPLIMYIKDEPHKKTTLKDWIVMALYGMLFSIPVLWGLLTDFALNYGYYTLTYVERHIYHIAYFLMFFVVGCELFSWSGRFRNKAATRLANA